MSNPRKASEIRSTRYKTTSFVKLPSQPIESLMVVRINTTKSKGKSSVLKTRQNNNGKEDETCHMHASLQQYVHIIGKQKGGHNIHLACTNAAHNTSNRAVLSRGLIVPRNDQRPH